MRHACRNFSRWRVWMILTSLCFTAFLCFTNFGGIGTNSQHDSRIPREAVMSRYTSLNEAPIEVSMSSKQTPSPFNDKNDLQFVRSFDLDTIKVNFESCMASLPLDRTKRVKVLQWLHIPKCGTSLGTVVHGYLCQQSRSPHEFFRKKHQKICDYCELEQMNKQGTPFWDGKIRALLPVPEIRKYCDWNVSYRGYFYGHNPLKAQQQLGLEDNSEVVALFRDPRRRAVSAWNHAKHTHHLGTMDAEAHYPNSRVILEKDTQTVQEFAENMHVRACQSKMLIGGQCGMYMNMTNANFELAKERLRKLAFVGITDAYNASVCLFHHMWGGVPQPHMFANARPATAHNKKWKPRKLPGGGMQVRPAAWQNISADADPRDFELFLLAKARFLRNLQTHHFLKPPFYNGIK